MSASTGRLDAELVAVSKRVSNVLMNLPRDITPVNLEELRRVKQCLVELESKADNLRCSLLTAKLTVVRRFAHHVSIGAAQSMHGKHQLTISVANRDMLEELMDDDDEVCKMNLTSRPKREERRRLRERERLERGMERCDLCRELISLPSV